jgi:glutaredoxin
VAITGARILIEGNGGWMEIRTRKLRLLRVFTLGLVFLLLLGSLRTAQAQSETPDLNTIIYFWGDGCPHCAEAKPFLQSMQDTYDIEVKDYEVWYNQANQALYVKMADQYNVPQEGRGVPLIIVGDRYWMGYNEAIGNEIEQYITEGGVAPVDTTNSIELPLIGRVSLAGQSTFVSTALIAFVDGFNPCSIWVLTMLLTLTLHTGSRKKVLIIGLIFLTVTTAVYGLFITGLFTMFTVVSFVGWIQVVVALVALFFAAVNIKDYFFYKEGLSFTISDKEKPGLFQRMRRLMDASHNFWSLAGATVVMAAGVSLVEFSCTAGFPVLWTNILVSQQVGAFAFIMLLLLYLLIYQLDEMVIFFAAVYTLKASKMEEKHGRILKLISGVLMLTLAVVMLANPAWLNSLSTSLVVFGVAFGVVALTLLVHRRILPAYGIWIGTENSPRRGKRRTGRPR